MALPTGPNIVLILADDMGYGDFGSINGGLSSTPALDQLMDEGVSLTQHYSASPVCAPARASLLTGRYPHRTGAIDTLEHRGLDRLALREKTLGDVLGRAAYTTGLIGKWHNGALDDRYHPNQRGFEEFAGFRGGWSSYWDWRLDRNGSMAASDGRYLTDVITEEAVDFVRRHHRDRFFLHVAYSAPHYPFEAPDEDVAPFREKGAFTEAVSTIYGMIRRMDQGVAAIVEALEELGLGRDTLVMFSSDNGPQFSGSGDYCTNRWNSGFRGAKGLVYEGGVRLPMVLRWPAVLPAGQVRDELVHFTDWLPTLLAVAGAEPAADLELDGVDVLPVLLGDGGSVPDVRFWQWNRYTPVGQCNAAMRHGSWKLVRPAIDEAMQVSPVDLMLDIDAKVNPNARTSVLTDPEPDRDVPAPPPPELYDLAVDPGEESDLAAAQPGRVARMEEELGRWFEAVEADRRSIPAD